MRLPALCLVVMATAACGDHQPITLIDAPAADADVADASKADAAAPDGFVPLDAPDDSFQPDLILLPALMIGSEVIDFRVFSANDPALLEGCVGATGTRKLLRFDTVTGNAGNLDLWVGVPSADNPLFEYSPAHQHHHVTGYAAYRLLDGTGVVATGRKQAFCLMDTTQMVSGVAGKYHCGNQGITAGWADTYGAFLDCQWIDVTDLPSGAYTLQIEVNPDQLLPESRFDNNLFELAVDL